MKKDIHPKYGPLKVKVDDKVYNLKSAYPYGDELLMDVNFERHPAWTGTGTQVVNESDKSVNAFNKKFAGLFSKSS